MGEEIDAVSIVTYPFGPDSSRQPGVPRAVVERIDFADSRAYPGTSRSIRILVPAQYSDERPAALMVWQDGLLNLDESLETRAGVVLENLIHADDMPVTIGVFVDPGEPGNRNAECDPADARYADFLLEEVLPLVRSRYSVTDDPERWAIAGGSSGGNCAFTVAWQRPDRFHKVLMSVASFAQIPGGDPYPDLIRDTPPKPLRIFQQASTLDLGHDRPEGNWFASNLEVAAALARRGYDHRLVLGDGGHSPQHTAAILPDALRWLWR